jgi:cystathionine gamma-lyase
LNLGADIVMYSMTKYMNGHADVIMGALVLNDDAVFKKLKDIQQRNFFRHNKFKVFIKFYGLILDGGAVPGPFDCYLALRGLKTLPVRMRQHMANSIEVAKFLQTHPKVEEVVHPGKKYDT